MTEITDWKDKIFNSAKKSFPDLIAETPIIGAAARDLIHALGYDKNLADSFFNSLLRKLSAVVDQNFCEDAVGPQGGLSYARSGSEKSNFLVSRTIAAWLNSITHPDHAPLSLKSIVISLLHERTWQCRDSGDLYNHYAVVPLLAGVGELKKRLNRIVDLATDIRNITLAAVATHDAAKLLFENSNAGTTVQQYIDYARKSDSFSEFDASDCLALSTTPMLLIERYVDLFAQDGKESFHYIPYLKPFDPPRRDSLPMLQSSKTLDRESVSPGLAIENIVRIAPFPFLDLATANGNRLTWPYGHEMESAFINLKPPFELWCDFGKSVRPEWVEPDRVPDVVGVLWRNGHPSDEQWNEYEQHASPSLG